VGFEPQYLSQRIPMYLSQISCRPSKDRCQNKNGNNLKAGGSWSMDIVIVWLVIDFLLVFGFVTAGFLVEGAINQRADAVITGIGDSVDNLFSTWVQTTQKKHLTLLAVILRLPIFLCYSLVSVLVFLILPFPLPAEFTVPFLLFLLFIYSLFWIPAVADRAKELRRKAVESMQTRGV